MDTDAMAARLYPSSSAAPPGTALASVLRPQESVQAAPAGPGGEIHQTSHPHDMGARLYPQQARDATTEGSSHALGEPNAVAERMYPTMEELPPEDLTVTDEQVAAKIPANIAELRDGSPETRLYANTMAEALPQDMALPIRRELGSMFLDMGISREDMQTIWAIGTHHQKAAPDAATLAEWEQSVTPEERVAAAALLARDSRTAALAEQLGIGTHPRVVQLLAAAAEGQRQRQRLKY